MLAMTQETILNILELVGSTPWTQGSFFYFLGLCLLTKSRNTGCMDIHEILRIWTQEEIGYTVSRLSRLFHALQTRRGGGLHSRIASCWQMCFDRQFFFNVLPLEQVFSLYIHVLHVTTFSCSNGRRALWWNYIDISNIMCVHASIGAIFLIPWLHDMETQYELLTLNDGNHRSPVNSPCEWVHPLLLGTFSRTNIWFAGDGAHVTSL